VSSGFSNIYQQFNNIAGFRGTLRQEQRTLGRNPSLAKRTKIQDRRRRLLVKINAFQKKTDHFWGDLDLDELTWVDDTNEAESDSDTVDSEDTDVSDEGDASDEGDDEVQYAEDIRLLLPSSLGHAECIRLGKSTLMEQEIQLREGQANDALEELRMALAHKSLLYRTRLRVAKSQRTETRAWDSIKKANVKVKKHVRMYHQAYKALLSLDSNTEGFQPITKDDLKMSGDIVEETRIGQRSDTLAWFWRLGNMGQREGDDTWMEECEFFFILIHQLTNACISSLSC
jgi:hypothetical protein